MKDNLPVLPLHQAGFRKMIVIGLNPQVKLNAFDYPGTEFLPVIPSRDLGDFFSGTLDFTSEGAVRRMRLGYQDGKAVFEWYVSGQDTPWSEFQKEYRKSGEDAGRQIKRELKQSKLEAEINAEFGKLKELMRKYGVEKEEK